VDEKFYRHICAKECRNTHHKLVMNSLQHLRRVDADQWKALFVRFFEQYLDGSKAPDTRFKDFRNHVLHVSDGFWGGPVKQAEKWYARTVLELKNKNWRAAVYSAGVLSHYYMDPLMPLHTGQTEEEGVIHRACEWSVNKSFASLIEDLESSSGYPDVNLGSQADWLKEAIHSGATIANGYYQDFIDHYDPVLGSRKPEEGLDDHLREITAQLLGHASVGFARILERAIEESGVTPAKKHTLLWRLFYKITAPVSWSYSAFRNMTTKSRVKKIVREFKTDGKVVNALTTDDKTIRKQYAQEILKVDLTELDASRIGHVGSKHVTRQRRKDSFRNKSQSSSFRLELNDEIEAAPSIGPKTAKRFEAVGIKTVKQLLSLDADLIAPQLNSSHIRPDKVRMWQTQARLACQIPRIYGHDAQILTACGFDSPEEIAESEPEVVLSLVDEFAETAEAKFIIRGKRPDIAEVTNWVQWAAESRKLDAA
jgi:hypothetical protein